MRRFDRIFRDEKGSQIPGVLLPAFLKNGPYQLIGLRVFRDGMIECSGLMSFEAFKKRVEEGSIVTTLPEGAEVSVPLLGSFKATRVRNGVKEQELLKEVADLIEALNARSTSSERCLAALKQYEQDASEPRRMALRTAYEAVPEHLRRFVLGDDARKDLPIREIIYRAGESERPAPAAASGTRPEPLDGGLQLALHNTYAHSGVGQPVFPKEAHAEVEALFRGGREAEGVARLRSDIRLTLSRHGRRPMIVTRLAGALNGLAEYLESAGREEEAASALLESCSLSPDGIAAVRLAELAVRRNDAPLARALAEKMREFSLDAIEDEPMAEALGLDVAAFRALAGSAGK